MFSLNQNMTFYLKKKPKTLLLKSILLFMPVFIYHQTQIIAVRETLCVDWHGGMEILMEQKSNILVLLKDLLTAVFWQMLIISPSKAIGL